MDKKPNRNPNKTERMIEIEEMSPRAVDRAVAERICGARVRKKRGESKKWNLIVPFGGPKQDFTSAKAAWAAVPRYSRDLNLAWRAAKSPKVYAKRWEFYLLLQMEVAKDDGPYGSTTAWPEVIFLIKPDHLCRAALKTDAI